MGRSIFRVRKRGLRGVSPPPSNFGETSSLLHKKARVHTMGEMGLKNVCA